MFLKTSSTIAHLGSVRINCVLSLERCFGNNKQPCPPILSLSLSRFSGYQEAIPISLSRANSSAFLEADLKKIDKPPLLSNVQNPIEAISGINFKKRIKKKKKEKKNVRGTINISSSTSVHYSGTRHPLMTLMTCFPSASSCRQWRPARLAFCRRPGPGPRTGR